MFDFGGSNPTALRLSYIGFASYIALRQLYLPTASDIAHFVRSCGGVDFSPSVTSCHLPRQMEAFRREQAHRPTIVLFSQILCLLLCFYTLKCLFCDLSAYLFKMSATMLAFS